MRSNFFFSLPFLVRSGFCVNPTHSIDVSRLVVSQTHCQLTIGLVLHSTSKTAVKNAVLPCVVRYSCHFRQHHKFKNKLVNTLLSCAFLLFYLVETDPYKVNIAKFSDKWKMPITTVHKSGKGASYW